MAVSGIGNSPTLSAHTASNEERAAVEKEGFLKLLVAQLGNQDPMAPQDSDKYVDQLTNFSMLEQMMNLNKGVNNLSIGQLSNNSQDAVRFVGREIVAKGDTLSFDGSESPPVKYGMPHEAESATLSIYDSHGNLVRQEEVDASPGASQYTWDGRNNDGQLVAEGEYRIAIEATDAEDNPIPVDTYVRGKVESVRFDNGFPELIVNGRRLKMSDVTEVN